MTSSEYEPKGKILMGLWEREDTLSQRDFRRVNISVFVGQTSLEALCASFQREHDSREETHKSSVLLERRDYDEPSEPCAFLDAMISVASSVKYFT